jgi:hypothetical protein
MRFILHQPSPQEVVASVPFKIMSQELLEGRLPRLRVPE